MTALATERPALLDPDAAEWPTPLDMRVLCVDDNQDSADSLGQLLRLCGAEVVVCHNGPAALAVAADFRPDACVLDITMPDMDGYELARRLRNLFPNRPLLLAAVTALDGYRAYEREADAGFDLHFTKPALPGDLIDALSEYRRQRDD